MFIDQKQQRIHVGTGESYIEESQGVNPGFSWRLLKKKETQVNILDPSPLERLLQPLQRWCNFGSLILGLYSKQILKSTYQDLCSKMFITA